MIDNQLGIDTPQGKLDSKVAIILKWAKLFNQQFYKINLSPDANRRQINFGSWIIGGYRPRVFNVSNAVISTGIKIRIYRPSDSVNTPVIIFYHGGGFVVGNINTHDNICRRLANKTSSIVVSVDYRLAPENKFPAAANDAYEALWWVAENAKSFGGDPDRIIVAGDSAGGNLAIVVCLMSRDSNGPKIAYQIPIYPQTNMADLNTESYKHFGEGYYLTKPVIEALLPMYIADNKDLVNPYTSPLLADNFTDLPPALVITAEFDPLRDDGEAYAQKLVDAGIPVRVHRFKGMIHAFVSFGGLRQAHEAIDEIASTLQVTLMPVNKVRCGNRRHLPEAL